MSLKLARHYYSGAEFHYNPLWRRIAAPFQATFLSKEGDEEFTTDLYVADRLSAGYQENDLRDYISSKEQRLFVVEGPAGVGKTTLLHHTLRGLLVGPDHAGIWIDAL